MCADCGGGYWSLLDTHHCVLLTHAERPSTTLLDKGAHVLLLAK